jgi:hypothetical protein
MRADSAFLRALAAIAIAVGTTVGAAAQITTGSVTGTVTDVQGGVIPGATVTLVSETRGTAAPPTVTGSTGDFLFVNVAPDTYAIDVTMPSFKTLHRSGVSVSPGSRVAVGTLTIEVGGASEVVDVRGEVPLIQATSGERSFTITNDAVANLPIASRSFTALASLAPGVTGTTRIGGGGSTNVMMDGVSTLDTGSNAPILQMNLESIAELKVLTSGYQAEYGRSSGLQVTAVTKSGTNHFHESLYDVERNSDWNANSRTNILNSDPKTIVKERDWGYSIGGPIGRPGGNNKLFFFYSQEFEPRTAGNNVVRFRVPTALERQGDFSQTTDNLGAPYPYIKDPTRPGACSAASQAACFADGGVLGRLPANRLYQPGLNVLNQWPLPNIDDVPAGQGYNLELRRPAESALSWEPAIRVDYQPVAALRATGKYQGFVQRNQTFNGTLPGFNDTKMQHPVIYTFATTVDYTLNATTFIEATYGRSQNELAGCGLGGGATPGPTFCTSALPMNDVSNRYLAGLDGIPFLFPDAGVINPDYYAYRAFNMVDPPAWDGSRVLFPPTFAWGSRVANAPPSNGFTSFLNTNVTQDFSVSLTRVVGRHTLKAGFYNTHAYKAVNIRGANSVPFGSLNFGQDSVGTNPFDTSFGFANAAIGSFSSYVQSTAFVETNATYNNTEGYVQDSWKVDNHLTLDYGVRLVHQQPQHDILGQSSNFFPDRWSQDEAPAIYVAGCANGVFPCSGTNRQAMNPLTGAFLGPNTALAIGTLVPDSGNPTNGLARQGQGIAETTYVWPMLSAAPRFGIGYDVTGRQTLVLRGGVGLFFDRTRGDTTISAAANPPTSETVTVRYGQLQTLGQGGLTTQGAPTLAGLWDYDPGALPSSTQWNVGVQVAAPWAMALDVAYVGQHSFHMPEAVNLNAIDFGTAFLPEDQDPTQAPGATPGATSFAATNPDSVRSFRGYGAINTQLQRGWETFHSLQLSLNRRFTNGLSLGFNDTITLYDRRSTPARLQHDAAGTYGIRGDQSQADALLGRTIDRIHVLKGNFVWDLPDLAASGRVRRAVGLVVNDWQLSGVWTAATGAAYTVGYSYQSGGGNVNLTGSPDYAARVRVIGDPGTGCRSDVYRQFSSAAFAGPQAGSLGLESGSGYLRGCFSSALDLAIARTIRVSAGRTLQFRLDVFNAPNTAGITARNTTMSLKSPTDPSTIQNLPFDADGNLIAARSRPRGAGFGVATAYQSPRMLQMQIRFSF